MLGKLHGKSIAGFTALEKEGLDSRHAREVFVQVFAMAASVPQDGCEFQSGGVVEMPEKLQAGSRPWRRKM